MADAAAGRKPVRVFPQLLNGYTLDKLLIVATLLFFTQHPLAPSLPPVDELGTVPALLQQRVSSYVANTTAALANEAQRKQLAAGWYEYLLGSDLGGAANNNNAMLVGFYELNEWKNSLLLPRSVRDALPHVAAVWLRNYVAIHLVYFGLGTLWSLYIYWLAVDRFFPRDKNGKRDIPDWEDVRAQIWASYKALPFYVLMPTWTEWLVERGLTRCVDSFAAMGGVQGWLVWHIVYLFFVEWAIYWVHRALHDVASIRWLHHDHHVYNNPGTMSPFAGLAFHPLDGMAQAAPYLLFMLVFPTHFWTVEAMLFFTGVWTTNIHDTLNGNTEPVMGSKYHTYHHTAYVDNYGQFFVFFDWVHGTLCDPLEKKKELAALAAQGGEGKKAQ